ncbi:hypothetical protein SRB5_44580 [Streptomyces sp. RB5]|uniref:Nucleotidyl transferase AbiEii toxin, Type IV TA system n=1 Tax=Streptomyces smaragdinus TaxID=2585196 RepID=A0A7K0CNF5_9ACTN|nr:nucleotidyl transferase AbiEii/AbiGii toxin family protein [Streptomyces smaragdinus]MQY14294.1 hypothetical protein [Streptomyces smaragdinus]
MDALQVRLTQLGLGASRDRGFVLAGGYAVEANGFLRRISDDVDLFTDQADPHGFAVAVTAVEQAYQEDGLEVRAERMAEMFARLHVTDEYGRAAKVEMGYDWRARPPVVLDLGPVLHPDDAVAGKVVTVFTRAAPRDYIDVTAALASGRYAGHELLTLAEERDRGFERTMFAQALLAVDRFDDAQFSPYGLDAEEIAVMRATLQVWADEINGSDPRQRDRGFRRT